jgi:hypothetical protein
MSDAKEPLVGLHKTHLKRISGKRTSWTSGPKLELVSAHNNPIPIPAQTGFYLHKPTFISATKGAFICLGWCDVASAISGAQLGSV